MHLIFQAINTVLFAFFFYWFLVTNTRAHNRLVVLEQEKALKIGHDAGANWVLDMSVDDYVTYQAIRREEKTRQ